MVQDYVDKVIQIYGNSINECPTSFDRQTLRALVKAGYSYYNTMFFPKGTDPQIVEKFSTAVGKIITTNTDYQKEMAALDQIPTYRNTADSIAHWSKELDEMMQISDLLQGK